MVEILDRVVCKCYNKLIKGKVVRVMKFVDISKRSKKEQKAYYSAQRVVNGFNTGPRTMQTAKNPTRAKMKAELRNAAMGV